jgi:hypothetical protein
VTHNNTIVDSQLEPESGTGEHEPVATASADNGAKRKWMMEMNFCRKA